jgi:hypothetical protein
MAPGSLILKRNDTVKLGFDDHGYNEFKTKFVIHFKPKRQHSFFTVFQ